LDILQTKLYYRLLAQDILTNFHEDDHLQLVYGFDLCLDLHGFQKFDQSMTILMNVLLFLHNNNPFIKDKNYFIVKIISVIFIYIYLNPYLNKNKIFHKIISTYFLNFSPTFLFLSIYSRLFSIFLIQFFWGYL
jgi:hypothetical protein